MNKKQLCAKVASLEEELKTASAVPSVEQLSTIIASACSNKTTSSEKNVGNTDAPTDVSDTTKKRKVQFTDDSNGCSAVAISIQQIMKRHKK